MVEASENFSGYPELPAFVAEVARRRSRLLRGASIDEYVKE
jgi:hypothetical protein